MEWLWFELGGRHLAWCRTTGETREGAPPLPGGGNIEREGGAQKGQQFKFTTSSDGEQERGGLIQSWGSADSKYSSSLGSGSGTSGGEQSLNEERKGECGGEREYNADTSAENRLAEGVALMISELNALVDAVEGRIVEGVTEGLNGVSEFKLDDDVAATSVMGADLHTAGIERESSVSGADQGSKQRRSEDERKNRCGLDHGDQQFRREEGSSSSNGAGGVREQAAGELSIAEHGAAAVRLGEDGRSSEASRVGVREEGGERMGNPLAKADLRRDDEAVRCKKAARLEEKRGEREGWKLRAKIDVLEAQAKGQKKTNEVTVVNEAKVEKMKAKEAERNRKKKERRKERRMKEMRSEFFGGLDVEGELEKAKREVEDMEKRWKAKQKAKRCDARLCQVAWWIIADTAGGYVVKDRMYDRIVRGLKRHSKRYNRKLLGGLGQRGGAGVNDESRRIEDCTETILFREGGFEPD